MLGQVPSSAADSHSHEGRGFLGSMRDRLRDALQESEEHLLRRAREAVRAGLAAPRPSATGGARERSKLQAATS